MNKIPPYKELENKIKYLEKIIQEKNKNEIILLKEIGELNQTKEYYDALMQNTEDYILLSNGEGIPQAFNASYKKRAKELLNIEMKPGTQPHKLLDDPKEVKYWDSLHSRVLKGEKFVVEYSHRINQNKRLYFEISFDPIKKGNKIIGFTEITKEVTKSKIAEEAVRESEAKFKTLVDQAPAALFLHDMQGRIVDVNQMAISNYGYTKKQLLQMKAKDIDPEYTEREESGDFWQKLKKTKKIDFKARHRTKDGSIFPVSVSLAPIMLKDKEHIFALAMDTTDYQQAQEKLRDSEELFRTVFDQATVGMAQVAPNGAFMQLNSRFCEIIGYQKDELLNLTFRDISHPEDLDLDDTFIAKVMAGEIDSFEIEKRYIHKDGRIVWIKLYSNAVRNDDGSVKYAVAIITDISDRVKAVEAVKASEQKYRDLFESNADGIIRTKLDGVITEVNPTFLKMVGYDSITELKKTYQDLTPQKWHALEADIVKNQVFKRGYSDEYEKEYIHKDGTVFPISHQGMVDKGSRETGWDVGNSARHHRTEAGRNSFDELREKMAQYSHKYSSSRHRPESQG